MFSPHALVPRSTALLNTSLAPAARSKLSRRRTSVIPISSKTAIADCPCSFVFPSPSINLIIAPEASSLKALENCSADIPATSAKSFNFPDASVASLCIVFNSLLVNPIAPAVFFNSLPPFLTALETCSIDTPVCWLKLSNPANALAPFSTANCISTITLENAEPPASASIPTELNAAANPMI